MNRMPRAQFAVRILLLNLYYPPDTSATAKMAQTVVEALSVQHEVTVLCGRPSYDPTERRPWRLWQTEMARTRQEFLRVGSTDYPRFADEAAGAELFELMLRLPCRRALFTPCDVVLAMTDPPFEGIVGAFVALLKGKPYVYNIRDMYPDMAVGGAIVEPGLLARVWERLHRWALRRATRVVVLGEDMRARIVAKGVEPARDRNCPRWRGHSSARCAAAGAGSRSRSRDSRRLQICAASRRKSRILRRVGDAGHGGAQFGG